MIKKENKKPISMKRYFLKRFRTIIALFLVLFFVAVGSIFFTVYVQKFNHIKDTLELYNEQSSHSFADISNFMLTLTNKNQYVTSFSLAKSEEAFKYLSQIRESMASGLYTFPAIDGVFIYSQTNDIYIKEMNSSFNTSQNGTTDYKCTNLIEKTLKKGDGFPFQKWFILEADGDYYFVKIFKNKELYAGAWVNTKHTAAYFRYFSDLNAKLFFTDESGFSFDTSVDSLNFYPKDSQLKPKNIKIEKEPYLAVSAKLNFSEYYITALVPHSSIQKTITPIYYVLTIAVLVSIFLFFTANMFSSRYLDSSVNMLKPAIEEMKKGNFETKISSPNSNFSEIIAITDTYNEMVDEIRSLKIGIYEEQLKKQELELQYLKTQLAPHFLINCLNTVFMLSYDAGNADLIQKIIKTLSDHLRYSLSKQNRVSMEDELFYTKNYLTLTQLRFPESLDYTVECDPDLLDAAVFPMMILLLAENSIKVNLVLGEILNISIKIEKHTDESGERVRIICIDTGRGFDKEDLVLYNNIEENIEKIQDGSHIGLQNIYSRLKIIFGDSARFSVSNEPDAGARIDMDIPYIKHTAKEEGEQ